MSIGISGSVTEAATAYGGVHHSPLGCARADDLHLGQHPAQRLGVAATGHRADLGALDAADREDLLEHHVDLAVADARTAGHAARRWSGQHRGRARLEQPAPRLLGALGQGEEPAARVVAVVGQLLDALGRDRREHRVAAGRRAARTPRAGRSRTAAAARSCARSRRSRPRPAARCGSRSPRGRTPGRPRPAPATPRAAPVPRTGPRRPRAPAAAGPGRAGRARCWPARCPPRGRARGCTTPRAGAT